MGFVISFCEVDALCIRDWVSKIFDDSGFDSAPDFGSGSDSGLGSGSGCSYGSIPGSGHGSRDVNRLRVNGPAV